MKLINNRVLIKPDNYREVTLPDGFQFFVDTRFEVQKNQPQSGVVVQVPTLNYTISGANMLTVDADIEIQAGDRIIYHYEAAAMALKEGFKIGEDLLIRYSDIFLVIRDGEIFAINGYLVAEPVDNKIETTIALPDTMQQKSFVNAIVKYGSIPVRGYKMAPWFGADTRTYRKGDNIIFHQVNSIELMNSVHQSVDRGTTLYRLQNRDVAGIIAGASVFPVSDKMLLIQDPAPEFTPEGAAIPESARRQPPSGTIVSVGNGYSFGSLEVTPGDRVRYHSMHAIEFLHNGFPLIMLPEFAVICVL